jgi:hypothetical protein
MGLNRSSKICRPLIVQKGQCHEMDILEGLNILISTFCAELSLAAGKMRKN